MSPNATTVLDPQGRPVVHETANGQPAAANVSREDIYTIQIGQVVAYRIHSPMGQMVIAASRLGVEFIGRTPPITSQGFPGFFRLVRRVIRQHEALTATPVGEKQIPLTEEQLDQAEQADAQSRPSWVRGRTPLTAVPTPGTLPRAKGV